MKKISIVKSVHGNGTDTNNHGTLYKFDYEFEDGQSLAARHKSQTPFQVGEKVEYEVKGSNAYGDYGTVSKFKEQPQQNHNTKPQRNFQADPKKQTIIVAQSSMTKAVDILISGVVPMEFKDMNDFVKKAEQVCDLLIKKQIELANKHYQSF